MPFKNSVKEEALVRSRRYCNVCLEFAGLYTNVHHLIQESDGGSNDLGNAIVLCLRCHGEAGHYNISHPIGNKYSPSELRKHRDNWWNLLKNNPSATLLLKRLERKDILEAQREESKLFLDKMRYTTAGLNKDEMKKCKNALRKRYENETMIRNICQLVPRDMVITPEEAFLLHHVRTTFPKERFVGKPTIDNSYLFSQFGREIAIQELKYLQEQLLTNCKERIPLDTFSSSAILEQMKTYNFKPDFAFIPISRYSEIYKWQDEKGRMIVKYESLSSKTRLRSSLYLDKNINPKLIFSSKYRPLQEMIMVKPNSVKWHIKVDPVFGALSIRLGNSKLYSDEVELFASTTIKCEIDSEGVLVLEPPR